MRSVVAYLELERTIGSIYGSGGEGGGEDRGHVLEAFGEAEDERVDVGGIGDGAKCVYESVARKSSVVNLEPV